MGNYAEAQKDIEIGFDILKESNNCGDDQTIQRIKLFCVSYKVNEKLQKWEKSRQDLEKIKAMLLEKSATIPKNVIDQISQEIKINLDQIAEKREKFEVMTNIFIKLVEKINIGKKARSSDPI